MELPVRLRAILTGSIGAIAARKSCGYAPPSPWPTRRRWSASFREMEKDLATTARSVFHQGGGDFLAANGLLGERRAQHSTTGIVASTRRGGIHRGERGVVPLVSPGGKPMIGGISSCSSGDIPVPGEAADRRAGHLSVTGHWRGECTRARRLDARPRARSPPRGSPTKGAARTVSSHRSTGPDRTEGDCRTDDPEREAGPPLGQMAGGVATRSAPAGVDQDEHEAARDGGGGARRREVIGHDPRGGLLDGGDRQQWRIHPRIALHLE